MGKAGGLFTLHSQLTFALQQAHASDCPHQRVCGRLQHVRGAECRDGWPSNSRVCA